MALGETPEFYELIDGVVCMSPRPTRRHQRVLSLLQLQLEAYAQANPGFEYYPEVDVRFDDRHVYAPDLCCFLPGRAPALDQALTLPPDLIIEVISPGSVATDLVRKRADYGRFGVREYWVVDPDRGSVRCFRHAGGMLHEVDAMGGTITSGSLAGFVLDLAPIRALAQQG